jgi:hypothetical protein
MLMNFKVIKLRKGQFGYYLLPTVHLHVLNSTGLQSVYSVTWGGGCSEPDISYTQAKGT